MEANIAKIESLSGDHWYGGLSTVIYFAGCDYNCPNCNTPSFLKTNEDFKINIKDIKNIIKDNQSNIKAVVFTGGEPCLQRQPLLLLANFAKDLGLKTGIETNGSKTECIRSLLNLGIIDKVAIDLKAPFEPEFFERATKSKTFFKTSEALLEDIINTIRLLKRYQDKVDIEFRTTITPTLVSRKEDLFKIGKEFEDIRCIWVLNQFKSENVCDKRFSNIKSPSIGFLDNLKESIQKRYSNIRVYLGQEPF